MKQGGAMIFIVLLFAAILVIILQRLGFVKNPITIFVIAALIIGAIAIIFNNRLHCPFMKRCPFYFCPLHK